MESNWTSLPAQRSATCCICLRWTIAVREAGHRVQKSQRFVWGFSKTRRSCCIITSPHWYGKQP